jgi:hypothetical protein
MGRFIATKERGSNIVVKEPNVIALSLRLERDLMYLFKLEGKPRRDTSWVGAQRPATDWTP